MFNFFGGMSPEDIVTEDSGCAKYWELGDSSDTGIFVRVHSWDESKKHSEFMSLVGSYIKVSVGKASAQQSVQPTAFGVGKRGHLANLLVSLGKYLIKIGGG